MGLGNPVDSNWVEIIFGFEKLLSLVYRGLQQEGSPFIWFVEEK